MPLIGPLATAPTGQRSDPGQPIGESGHVVGGDEKSRLSIVDDLDRATPAVGDDGQAAGHGLDRNVAERLDPLRCHHECRTFPDLRAQGDWVDETAVRQ